MTLAPLHGRPAPLRFVRQRQELNRPHYRLGDLKTAPLSSRARRLRRRRLWTLALGVATALAVLSIAAWTVLAWRA